MIRTRLFWAGSAVAAVLSTHSLALAANYYFDSVAGDDGKDGTTEANAKKTLKMPTGSGNTVYIKRGSNFSGGLNASNVTVTTYGSGERPIFNGSISVSDAAIEGLKAMPTTGTGIMVRNNSEVRDCESDGANCTASAVAMSVNGTNNKIIGNYVHDYKFSVSGGSMDNSGGAEGIMVMASDNEVAFNTAVNLYSDNSTLGGYEGGCFEIVLFPKSVEDPGTISNVSFHHNYCERSVGLWEGCSGDFSATGGSIQEHHGTIENVTVSYNISVDSQWMYLLQPVNTDFRNVVFSNNTNIHTSKSKDYWPNSQGYTSMAMVVDTYTNNASGIKYETDNQYFKKGVGFQPGTIIVKNNIFVDDVSSTRNVMFMSNLTDHSNNIFVPSNASVSFGSGTSAFTLNSTEKKVDLAAMAFTSDYRLTADSTQAIDQGTAVSMTSNGSLAATALKPEYFQDVFNQDIDHHAVPCGSGVDIGASEYCSGAGGSSGTGGASTVSTGGASTVSTGGASTVSTGGTSTISTGGTSTISTGGKTTTGGSSTVGTGGKATTGGSSTVGTGGAVVSNTGGASNTNTGGSNASNTGGEAPTNTGGASVVANAGGQSSATVGGSSAVVGAGGANAGAPATTVSNTTPGAAVDQGSCTCRVAGTHRNGLSAALASLGLAVMALGRRRRSTNRQG